MQGAHPSLCLIIILGAFGNGEGLRRLIVIRAGTPGGTRPGTSGESVPGEFFSRAEGGWVMEKEIAGEGEREIERSRALQEDGDAGRPLRSAEG